MLEKMKTMMQNYIKGDPSIRYAYSQRKNKV